MLLAYEEETVELIDNEQDVIIDALDSIKIIERIMQNMIQFNYPQKCSA